MKKRYSLLSIVFLCFVGLGFGQTPWINEIHYDNSGGDVNEGIEVAVPTTSTCTNITLYLYNGSTGGTYANFSINTSNGTTTNGVTFYWTSYAGIQNGAPDGLALVCDGTVIQFLSYEGTFTATGGIANGLSTTDIGVSEGSTNTTESMQLQGTGCQYSDFSWTANISSTHDSVNTGQTINCSVSPHTVTFNGNGSDGGSMSNQTETGSTSLNTNAFTQTGCSFTNWNTASDGSGTSYADGATYDFSVDITLYAQWSCGASHTVTYDGNGSDGGSMSNQTETNSTSLNANAFTQTGCSFTGWNTAADGTGTAYTDGATYDFSADITLYAQWSCGSGTCLSEDFENGLPTSYTATTSYSLSSGTWTGQANGVIRSTISYTGSYALQLRSQTGAQATTPNLNDVQTVTFWARASTSSGGMQVNYSTNGGSIWIQAPESPYSLTTAWTQFTATINSSGTTLIQFYRTAATVYIDDVEVTCSGGSTYYVTYDGNGNDGGAVPTDGYAYSPGDNTVTVLGNTGGLTNTGFTFSGWNTAADGSGTHYNASDTFSINANTILYAEWSCSSAYNVTTFSPINDCGDIHLNWTLPTSCYDEVLVVAKANSAVTSTPSGNGTSPDYIANSVFGTAGTGVGLNSNEYAVYEGTGTSVTVTGLSNNTLYHFEIFTREGSNWSSGMTTSATSISSSSTPPTIFNPGDLVFIGFDSYIYGATDKYSILTMVDIGPGTEFIIANLLYEWNDAANTSSGRWYDCYDNFAQDPPYALIQYTGCADIPKGSIICVETVGAATISNISINGNYSSSSDFTIDATNNEAGNISTSNPDAMWLMQGTFSAATDDGTDGPDSDSAPDRFRTFTGTVFGALQTKGYFKQLSDNVYTDYRISRIHPDVECLYQETGPTSSSKFFGFYYGITSGTQYQLLSQITDITNYWDIQSGTGGIQDADNIDYLCNGFFSISTGATPGQWVGGVSTDWFDCHNWQNFTVPDASVDVVINSTSTNHCDINASSTFAPKYNYVADCNDILINTRRLTIDTNGDILNVFGDLTIDTGTLDMNDSNNGTVDGTINLTGHWINNSGQSNFDEGNGTVVFNGFPNIQRVNYSGGPPTPPTFNTEEFYNVVLDNNFNTYESNDLHANGDLTINSNRTLTVTDGDYVFVEDRVTTNGTFYIENNGSLVQGGSGVNTNVGDIIMDRTANGLVAADYVYWSSPIAQFDVNDVFSTSNYIYKWNPTLSNGNGGQGTWESAVGDPMAIGKGYIVRVPNSTPASLTAQFFGDDTTGVPNNGNYSVTISRGSNMGVGNNSGDPGAISISVYDDNWNLVGNPYPSAISAREFLTTNSSIDGFVCLWRHLTSPSSDIDPFYDDFADGSNYTHSDYMYYNLTGVSTPPGFDNYNVSSSDRYIGAGQSFLVNMNEGPSAASSTVLFNNSMRDISHDNSQFFRTAGEEERHRLWVNLYNSDFDAINTILVGYVSEATMDRDRLYDAVTNAVSTSIYSLIEDERFIIQGRALPFVDSDRIPLGLSITTSGSFYIGIAALDGLFETDGQTVYLKDNYLDITFNISEDPYSFTSEAGEFNDRFEIVFQPQTLSIDDDILSSTGLTIIDMPNDYVKFKVDDNYTISKIEIIDLLGRTLYNLKGNNSEETYYLPQLSQSAYFAKVTLDSGQILTKKAIKK